MEAVRSERSSAHQARRLGQRLPLAETYTGLMQGCVAAGEGELDNSVVIQEIRRRTFRDG
jgi:3-hydroxyisobutyrate dehydrogenase-like beta-hydroxyacid dehydrogenase